MPYSSLLLSDGFSFPSARCEQTHREATLIIGIGGTGVSTLAALKRKVYQQFIPDNPGDPVPRYDHIRFLAIDSDRSLVNGTSGNPGLDPSIDFFHLFPPSREWADNDAIRTNPLLDWMEIDQIQIPSADSGAGAIRQAGRFLLMERADALKTKIRNMCIAACHGLDQPPLNIYLFAGLSGGTGSGCFLDTCYIVRKVLEDMDLTHRSTFTGLFFLPDVIPGLPGTLPCAEQIQMLHANGYAALKELDYHMDLQSVNASFSQNYGAFRVDTQEAPVDFCLFLSGTASDGSPLYDAMRSSIETCCDYVLSCLAGTHGPLSLYSLLHPPMLSPGQGANHRYCFLSSTRVERPTNQIAAYLAAGLCRRFQERVGPETVDLSQTAAEDLMQKLGISAHQVYEKIIRGCDALVLPDTDRNTLIAECAPGSAVPRCWEGPGRAWLEACRRKQEENRAVLLAPLTGFDCGSLPEGSLIATVFRNLYERSADPEYGPYYAAGLLRHSGCNLISALDNAIRQLQHKLSQEQLQLHAKNGPFDYAAACSIAFHHSILFTRNQTYIQYRDSVHRLYTALNHLDALQSTCIALEQLKRLLHSLYFDYFLPFTQFLDQLNQTFRENLLYLNGPNAVPPPNVREIPDPLPAHRLNQILSDLPADDMVRGFMHTILSNRGQWCDNDDSRIGHFISRFLEQVFSTELSRSLLDELSDLFPAVNDPHTLALNVARYILNPLYPSTFPTFWCNPGFDLSHCSQVCSISVPSGAPIVENAAQYLCTAHPECTVRLSGCSDRITILRLLAGVPLYACSSLSSWKEAYDHVTATSAGAGLHLYARTSRGLGASQLWDWRTRLPDPGPLVPSP